ncbi:hypothetical protein WH47_04342 [Habropoda laboriosa]|uniref:Uncharacterized protein n=1 Tax=Habropoda laboriosa TaxID=597456 RepID=A0A0L7QRF0_9HYME|nr:hypothetical protein WH47_04342 [Habropoda laboriosa]
MVKYFFSRRHSTRKRKKQKTNKGTQDPRTLKRRCKNERKSRKQLKKKMMEE